jgi:conserved hypothetical protein YidD
VIAPLRSLAIALVQVYRYGVSPILPASCRFSPSCSTFTLEAVRRYGALTGGWLGLRRVLRCHPWGDCGYDPVPDLTSRAGLAGGRASIGRLRMERPSDQLVGPGDGEPGIRV